jgi:hypothetical protein
MVCNGCAATKYHPSSNSHHHLARGIQCMPPSSVQPELSQLDIEQCPAPISLAAHRLVFLFESEHFRQRWR